VLLALLYYMAVSEVREGRGSILAVFTE